MSLSLHFYCHDPASPLAVAKSVEPVLTIALMPTVIPGRMPTLRSMLLLTVLMVLALAPGSAAAEEPYALDDVLITAALEPVTAREVASSVTVITREQIEQRQSRYLADLLRGVPGFAISQAGGLGTQTQVRVRGAEANHLLVLIDGVRANDPASVDEFQFQYQLTSNIERIEIIRGPQSAIWGTDALAGVINIIRRKPVEDRYLNAAVEHGSFDSRNLALDGGVQRGRLQVTGGLAHLDTDGTNIARQGDERDGARNTNLNAALAFDVSEAVQWRFSGQHIEARTDYDDFDFVATGLPVDADRVTEAERRYLRGELRLDPPASRWSGSASANWLDTRNDNFAEGLRDTATAAEALELRLRASVLLGPDGTGSRRLTLALDRHDIDFRQRGTASPFGDPNQDQSYQVTGYALEYFSNPTERFSWTANARQDDFSAFDDAFSWQLAAAHQWHPALRLRGSAGTGSKAPTFTDRFGFFPGSFVGNPDLQPETSTGWELGVDIDLASPGWQLGAAYFRQTLEDEIDGFVFDPATVLFTARNQPGESQRNGLELALSGAAGSALTFTAAYTYLDATEQDATGAQAREARRPRHLANMNANYRFGGDRGLLNLDLNYNGTQLDNFFPPPFFGREQVALDGFVVAGLAASWKLNRQVEVLARVTNLLDEDYEEILGFARPGRAVYFGLRGRLQR